MERNMTQINEFNRKNLKDIRADIDKALLDVANKYGIKISAGSARFSESNVTFKVEAATISSNGTVKTKGAVDLERFYPKLVGKKVNVTVRGRRVPATVIEYHSRKYKNPFIVITGAGARYKMPEYMVA